MLDKKGILLLAAMQRAIAKDAGRPFHGVFIAKNQAPPKRNGGRPTFKQNRRAQLRRSKK